MKSKSLRRILSFALAIVMMGQFFPSLLTLAGDGTAAKRVTYNLGTSNMTIGYSNDGGADVFFDDDGGYQIQLENGAYFPYDIQFTLEGKEPEVKTFKTMNTKIEVGGHLISVKSDEVGPGEEPTFTGIAFNIGGERVPALMEKTFSQRNPNIQRSLLPIPYTYLTVDITGFSQEDLAKMTVEYMVSGIPVGNEVIMWNYMEDGEYLYDDYAIVQKDQTFRAYHNLSLELLIGPPEALNPLRARFMLNFQDADYVAPPSTPSADFTLYDQDDQGVRTYLDGRSGSRRNGIYHYNMRLKEEYDLNRPYFLTMYVYSTNRNTVQAYTGHYDSAADAAAAGETDITADLLQYGYDTDAGYKAVFADPVNLTIFFDDGTVRKCVVQAITVEENLNDYMYFSVQNLLRQPDPENSIPNNHISIFRLRYNHDTYIDYNNYLTYLVQDDTFDPANAVLEFDSHEKAQVVAAGEQQVSKVSKVDFSGGPVLYTVSAGDGAVFMNYNVDLVASTPGAKLYVHGPDTREVLLDNDEYDKYHDIFFANIGRDEDLTGIKVELLDAVNIKLDDYWTADGSATNGTLAPFTQTYASNSSGGSGNNDELWNIGKIRILADGVGTISGTLRFTTANGGERNITLIGTAGDPTIVTEELKAAHRLVPYSFTIQSNTYKANDVTFRLVAGTLPTGVELRPSGEIYGAPLAQGAFPITVEAVFASAPPVQKEFVFTVNANTDANLLASNDYIISVPVPRYIDGTAGPIPDQEFRIEGEYKDFVDFWIDGFRRVRDVDYRVEEGSTVITIGGQTIGGLGGGSHTIAGEFGTADGTKVAAQNFDLNLGGNSGGSTGSGSGSSGSSTADSAVNTATDQAAILNTNMTRNSSGEYVFVLDGSGKPMEIRLDMDYSRFRSVSMDGNAYRRGTDYTDREGSTIVSINAASLEKLEAGVHTVTARFTTRTVNIKFRLQKGTAAQGGQPTGTGTGTGTGGGTTAWDTMNPETGGYHPDGYQYNPTKPVIGAPKAAPGVVRPITAPEELSETVSKGNAAVASLLVAAGLGLVGGAVLIIRRVRKRRGEG